MAAPPPDVPQQILHEATRLFVDRGYHALSMREIAEAVGVSKAGLYYHFEDKEDLFLAILTNNLVAAAGDDVPLLPLRSRRRDERFRRGGAVDAGELLRQRLNVTDPEISSDSCARSYSGGQKCGML